MEVYPDRPNWCTLLYKTDKDGQSSQAGQDISGIYIILSYNHTIYNFSKYRYVMSKLRMSLHRQHVETGRWSKPKTTPLNERTCNNCNIREDEFHFVLECKLFTDIRNRYIPIFYRNHPSMYKLITPVYDENKNIIRNLEYLFRRLLS